ncbi:hypothetical protein VF21_10640 [Pseudogymnoascus sp. 05NY08]|nr:hypothetical protein VF21_10640 [Pseudogymnoascus sp. 05NY08]
MSVVSSKGKAPTTPTSSQRSKPKNEEMPNALAVNELRETLCIKLPDTYSGNHKDLEVFLLQVELGEALWWVEPFLKDYFLWKGFWKEIRRMFGDIDEVKTAEDHLLRLKQTGSTLTYATEF